MHYHAYRKRIQVSRFRNIGKSSSNKWNKSGRQIWENVWEVMSDRVWMKWTETDTWLGDSFWETNNFK